RACRHTMTRQAPREEKAVQSKRNRDRFRLSLVVVLMLGLSLTSASLFGWVLSRQPQPITVRYGDLVQALKASQSNPQLSAQKAQVSHAEIRGDFVTTDRVSTGTDETTHTQTVPFRTARSGFERDQDVYALLRDSPGSSYQGEEGDSALKTIG